MASISLTDGIALPETFEGLPRIATSAVDTDVLAALYSDASGPWIKLGERWERATDPSGDAIIILCDRAGGTKTLPKFRMSWSGVIFAVSPHGEWALAQRGRRLGTDDDTPDIAIFDATGSPTHAFDAGGNIEFLQIAGDRSVWIGHGDDDPADGIKLGGLSHFFADGTEVFHRDFAARPETPKVSFETGIPFWCCYALNVCGQIAWTQHYDSMLITRFEPDGSALSWITEENGAKALAVSGSTIARIGRYDEKQHQVSVFRLGQPPHSEFVGRLSLDIDGWQPKYPDWIDGKGDTFHIVQDSKWYRITLDDILSHIGARNG
jgi:hypothetical protein